MRDPGGHKIIRNMKSKASRKIILGISLFLLVANTFTIDYQQLWSRENLGAILRMLTNLFVIAAMLVSLRHTRKQEQ